MDLSLLDELARWENGVSPSETGDPLWKLHAYRVARSLVDCCSADLSDAAPPIHPQSADQLQRAVGSICANIGEGYSRRTPGDRARFYSYALGSIRDSTVWYMSVRRHLQSERLGHRIDVLVQNRRLVLGMINKVSGVTGRASGL